MVDLLVCYFHASVDRLVEVELCQFCISVCYHKIEGAQVVDHLLFRLGAGASLRWLASHQVNFEASEVLRVVFARDVQFVVLLLVWIEAVEDVLLLDPLDCLLVAFFCSTEPFPAFFDTLVELDRLFLLNAIDGLLDKHVPEDVVWIISSDSVVVADHGEGNVELGIDCEGYHILVCEDTLFDVLSFERILFCDQEWQS